MNKITKYIRTILQSQLMSLINVAIVAGVALSMASCAESEDTKPSYADTDRLETLIDNSIQQIADFKNTYGTYILYNFDKQLDFAYQFENASTWNEARLTTIGHDDASVAVSMLYSRVFNCYGDNYKKEYFPRKLLIVDDIMSSQELGLSLPKEGHHMAVANINSVTFAGMSVADIESMATDASKSEALLANLHRALLCDYLVKARGEYPVDDTFFNYSMNDYSSLMDNRNNVSAILKKNPSFFHEHGFFNPDDDELTYFPSAEDDVVAYIQHIITMDEATRDTIMNHPVMAAKMHVMCVGLHEMGVDLESINTWTREFTYMDDSDVLIPSIVTQGATTNNGNATLSAIVYRGAHDLSRITATVGTETKEIDLHKYGNKARVAVTFELSNLAVGENIVTLNLYEEGRTETAATVNAVVNYISMANIRGFRINCSTDHEDVYRRIYFSYGDGYPVDEKEQNPNLTTIRFEKHGWMDNLLNENDYDYRAWKIYKEEGHVTKIMAYERGFNEDKTAIIYTLTDTYTFSYNYYNELLNVKKETTGEGTETIISDVAYAGGQITRYNYMGRIYEPKYATVNGKTTRIDILDTQMTGRCFGFSGNEELNPYYMQELPAVLPGSVAEIPLQLLYSKYLFNSIEGLWNGGWTTSTADKTNKATVNIDGAVWEYIFVLK